VIAPAAVLERVRQLPTLPVAVARLAALLEDPRSSAGDFERVIRPDPALTANLLRLANSAYFGLPRRVESVRDAITLLGLRRVFEVTTTAATSRVIPPRLPGYEIDSQAFWQHCLAVAVLAERLGVELKQRPGQLLFTMGLLHDVGKLVVGTFLAAHSPEVLACVRAEGEALVEAERAVLGFDHAEMGAAVADAWSLPPAVAAAARWHHAPDAAPAHEPRLPLDLIHAADNLSHVLGLGADVGELHRTVDRAATERLGLTARRLEHVAGECFQQIRELGGLAAAPEGAAP
jgi:putative nucleotidyltransferase with HDIG domain